MTTRSPSRPRGKWVPRSLLVGVALALLAVPVSRFQVGALPPREALPLRLPFRSVVEVEHLAPSHWGFFAWVRGERLTLRLSSAQAGDLIKVKARGDHQVCTVWLEVGSQPVASLQFPPTFVERSVVVSTGQGAVALRRQDSSCVLHFARVTRQGYLALTGEGLGAAFLLSRHRPRETAAHWTTAMAPSLPVWGAAMLAWLRWLGRGGRFPWWGWFPLAVGGLQPLAFSLFATLAGGRPWYPPDTLWLCWLWPVALVMAVGVPRVAFLALRGLRRQRGQWKEWWTGLLAFLGQRVSVSESFVFGLLGGLTALWLVVTLPRTPMEWDEVLFARALVKLDVVQHSPHPPGYPVYVAAGKLLKALGIPPVHASQLVSVAGLILALTSLSAWLRSLGIPPWPRLWTWLAVLFTPCVIFAANVGLSDMFAGGLAVFAWHLLWQVHQHPTPGRAVAAGIVTALALGARPQELLLLLVPGTWFVVRGMVRRQWAWVWFLAAGLVATVSVWLPLMWLTGWERYWQAFWKLHRWMQEFEGHTRWPHMPWLWFPQDWLLRPVGGPMLGAFFWLGVIVATAALWRSGRRWVLGAWAAGGSYLFLAPFFMTAEAAVRYALPGFLLLASLWGGLVLRWPRLGWLPVAGWVLAACFWVLPALTLRAAEPSPVWAALEMARDRVPTAPVWVASGLTPHAEVIFAWDQRRFQPVALERGLPPRGFLVVCDRWVRGRVWFSLVWPKEPMASLTRRRYLSARVVELGVR